MHFNSSLCPKVYSAETYDSVSIDSIFAMGFSLSVKNSFVMASLENDISSSSMPNCSKAGRTPGFYYDSDKGKDKCKRDVSPNQNEDPSVSLHGGGVLVGDRTKHMMAPKRG